MAKSQKPKKKPAQAQSKQKPVPAFTRGSSLARATQDSQETFEDFSEIAEPKKRLYLQVLSTTPRMTVAAKKAGISPRTAYAWRNDGTDPAFVEAFHVAYRLGVMRAESELWRRGVEGVEQPVYHQGMLVGSRQEYDTTAAIFMLKGALPEVYRERYEMSGPGGGPIQTESHITLEALLVRQQVLSAALLGQVIDTTATPVTESAETQALRYAEALAKRNGGGNGNNGHG